MNNEPNRDERLYSPLKVRELLARLRDTDPDFLVLIDVTSQALLIVNPRPGFCSPMEGEDIDEIMSPTEEDQEFLRNLHIK